MKQMLTKIKLNCTKNKLNLIIKYFKTDKKKYSFCEVWSTSLASNDVLLKRKFNFFYYQKNLAIILHLDFVVFYYIKETIQNIRLFEIINKTVNYLKIKYFSKNYILYFVQVANLKSSIFQYG